MYKPTVAYREAVAAYKRDNPKSQLQCFEVTEDDDGAVTTAASTAASEPWNADEIIEPLADQDVFEFNFLTFVEDKITPEDIMEYQHISENREHCFLVETLSENRKWYTLREFRNAKRARELYHNSGYMTVEDFKRILRQPNMI